MKTPLTPADIDWLGRNIPQYCSGAAKLSRNAEARIAQILNRESPHAGEQISDVARLALDHLAAETKVGQFQWSTAVNPHSIPSLIRLPGVGWGIVYAKGDSGRWLIDLPDGVLKTGLFPRGTQFAPLHSLAVQEEGGESALSLFRRAILSRKSLFLQAASASLLANFLVLGASLYSMQVYDRVIPTQSTATLWVLTVGVLLSVLMELVVKIARSRIMDEAISGIDLDLHDAGELTPVVAALGALAEGTTVVRGVAHIRGHETDRLAALVAELTRAGIAAHETDDGLVIEGGSPVRPAVLRTYADHRLVHFAALLALRAPGTAVDDLQCVSKTMPRFPEDWARLVG